MTHRPSTTAASTPIASTAPLAVSPGGSHRDLALSVLESEAQAVRDVARAIDHRFDAAVEAIHAATSPPALAPLSTGPAVAANALVATGVGKAGHIARKLSATFSSTGTPSHFLSPADAVHGDLGSVRPGDVVLMLSSSGESEEIVRLLSIVKKLGATTIAITASARSELGKNADILLETGKISEACPLGLAPSASTTAMLALGDALALCVMQRRNFSAEDFALYHPAGQLGRKLMTVAEAMTFRKGENLPLAPDTLTVAQVLHEVSRFKRRSGAVILTAPDGRISGLFTDGDLRRVITDADASALQQPVANVMTRNPKRILATRLASEAMALMHKHRIDELPVVDANDHPQGLIDVQDLVILKMLDIEKTDE